MEAVTEDFDKQIAAIARAKAIRFFAPRLLFLGTVTTVFVWVMTR